MKYFKINDKNVVTGTLDAPDWAVPSNEWQKLEGTANVGDLYQNGVFSTPVVTNTVTTVIRGNTYFENRKINYPSIESQLESLWNGMHENATLRIEPFYSSILAVKDAFPKDPVQSEYESELL
jgi:hypothetical protein